ncbi:MAG TPA: EamA family transporter [Aggregatilineaceae bacterium]|nr:EamA family transporter [Aggregatilineaceae bacterium]
MSLSDIKTERQGIALVLVGAFCFSLAIPLVRWTHGLNTMTIAFYRALFALAFLCTLLVRFHEPVRFAAYRASMRALIVLGLAVSLTVVLYTYAIRHTTAANAALLVNSAPIYVAVLAPFVLKEPRARYAWASLGLAAAGIACVSNPARLDLQSSAWGGIAAAALSGFTYAIVLMIGRSLRERVSGLTQNLWSQGIIALVLLPWALRSSGATVVSNLPTLIPLGVFTLGLSYLLYFQGLHRISAQVVSVVALFEPVSGIVMGLVFFAEVPNRLGWVGGILILVSIYLIALD